jgi:hypothetical protein
VTSKGLTAGAAIHACERYKSEFSTAASNTRTLLLTTHQHNDEPHHVLELVVDAGNCALALSKAFRGSIVLG